jgi:hypothetical protein
MGRSQGHPQADARVGQQRPLHTKPGHSEHMRSLHGPPSLLVNSLRPLYVVFHMTGLLLLFQRRCCHGFQDCALNTRRSTSTRSPSVFGQRSPPRAVPTVRPLFTVGIPACPPTCRGAAMPFDLFCMFAHFFVAQPPAHNAFSRNGCLVWLRRSPAQRCACRRSCRCLPLPSVEKLERV